MRLTDRARAAALKDIITRMEAGGYEVAEENKIYIKLAEFENAEEDFNRVAIPGYAGLYEIDTQGNVSI